MQRPFDDGVGPTDSKQPVFLTKAQREQIALQKREEEIAEQKRLSEQLLLHRRPSLDSKNDDSSRSNHHHRSSRDRERDRDRERERERDSERRNREREQEEEQKAKERARLEKLAEREKEKEIESIKEQYLGSKKPKKRVIKPSEKFRFSFDWENTEDTSRDMNFLYQNPHEARLLFGRGFRAGMDRREQKKQAAKNEKDLRDEIRKKDGVEENPEEAAAQKLKDEAADLYDTFFFFFGTSESK
ncbi:hypothetical protein Vadar_021272 [Vaccinium darrowii]|uniref:Uncharacterized protein n=1 Tax=Vaccinium darrowii TaxID=229202 RepID=A0ACB7YZ21_9ERIC|nr:hypothetical protein Vadar_021272 [Vaccinium darrowii]